MRNGVWRWTMVGCVWAGVAAALTYDANEKISVAPAIAFGGDDFYAAWARLDRTLKFGRFSLSPAEGGQAIVEAQKPMTPRTNDPFGFTVGGGDVYLAWADYPSGKVNVARYPITAQKDFGSSATKTTNVKPQGGVTIAYDDNRLYLGYTDNTDKIVKIVCFDVGQKGKISQETERKLTECETVVGSAVAAYKGTLVVAWVSAEKKFMLTTYKIERSSKGTGFTFLKETRTEIKAMTDPWVDRPALAADEGEVYLAYVDKNDKTAHVNFYELKEDGALKSTGETRVSERPPVSVGVAVAPGGKVYVSFADQNKNLFFADK